MKTLLILVATSIILGGCAVGSFPDFPEIKYHYAMDIRGVPANPGLLARITNLDMIPEMREEYVARCMKFEIVQKIPYKIKYISEVPLIECQGVGGYKPSDAINLYNWVEDVAEWAKDRKKCFK